VPRVVAAVETAWEDPTDLHVRDGVLVEPARDGLGLLVLERWAAEEPGAAEFRLTRLDLAGDTVYSQTYRYTPVPLPRSAVDSEIEGRTAGMQSSPFTRDAGISAAGWRRRVTDAIVAPPFLTPVTELVPGRDGSTWLALNPPAPPGRTWLILAEDGTSIERVMLPEGLQVLGVDLDTVWGAEQDELGVPYIVRYRVVRTDADEAAAN
jgi:hypothetical protein